MRKLRALFERPEVSGPVTADEVLGWFAKAGAHKARWPMPLANNTYIGKLVKDSNFFLHPGARLLDIAFALTRSRKSLDAAAPHLTKGLALLRQALAEAEAVPELSSAGPEAKTEVLDAISAIERLLTKGKLRARGRGSGPAWFWHALAVNWAPYAQGALAESGWPDRTSLDRDGAVVPAVLAQMLERVTGIRQSAASIGRFLRTPRAKSLAKGVGKKLPN